MTIEDKDIFDNLENIEYLKKYDPHLELLEIQAKVKDGVERIGNINKREAEIIKIRHDLAHTIVRLKLFEIRKSISRGVIESALKIIINVVDWLIRHKINIVAKILSKISKKFITNIITKLIRRRSPKVHQPLFLKNTNKKPGAD